MTIRPTRAERVSTVLLGPAAELPWAEPTAADLLAIESGAPLEDRLLARTTAAVRRQEALA